MKSKVQIIPATATKLDGKGAVVITVDPQFAEYLPMIFDEVRRLVGHERVTIFPLPAGAIKFYSVKTKPEEIVIEANVKPIGGLDVKKN